MAPKVKRKKPAGPAPSQPAPQGFVIREEKIIRRTRPAPPSKAQGGYTDQRITLLTAADVDLALAWLSRTGKIDRYYWFVEVKIPGSAVDSPVPVITAAMHPGGTLPLVPVGPDAEVSRVWASLLLASFEDYNRGTGLEFALNLAEEATFANLRAYEWGDPLDAVCDVCGQVFRHTAVVTICEECQRRPGGSWPDPDHYTAQWLGLVRSVAADCRALGMRP